MFKSALAVAALRLGEALGTAIDLEFLEALREDEEGPLVARCRVRGSQSAPSTVVLKVCRRWAAYDPDASGGPAGALLTEWAALEWLGELGVTVVPQILAGDREAGLVVLADIPHERRVDQLLLGDDPSAAASALIAFGTSLGRLHAATLGASEAEWRKRRGARGPIESGRSRAIWFAEQIDAFRRACAALGVDSADTNDDLEKVRQATTLDNPLNCLVHGDPCPDNLLVRDGSVVIVDFEMAGWWFAPRDAVYARAPFPTCWCMGLVPDAVVLDVEDAYRATAGFRDDQEWASHVAMGTAQWFLWTVPDLVLRGFEENHDWGTTGIRARIAPRSTAFAAAARQAEVLESLAAVADEVAAKARALWQAEAYVGPYPAFRDFDGSAAD